MKTLYLFLTVFLLMSQAPAAVMKIPAGVFGLTQLEEAVKQAKEKKKPLAIVAADEQIAGKALVDITEDTLKALMTYAVVVFVDAGRGKTENIAQLAPPFFTAFQDVGKPSLPVVLIGTPTEDEVWVTVNGTELSDGKHKKALRQTAATVKLKADPYFASKTAVPPVKPGDKMLLWGKADGKGQYKGKFLALEGDNIRVANPAGEQGSVPLSDLNPAGIRYAKFIGGESAPESAAAPAEEKKPAAAVERWTNKDGKELQATFVSLANGKVTLRSAAGKDYVLPLESLSAVSQARAKELAAPAAKKDKP